MGQEDERAARLRAFAGYTVDDALLATARPRRGASCTACPRTAAKRSRPSVIDGPASVVWHQAANRMHAARALLADLLEEE